MERQIKIITTVVERTNKETGLVNVNGNSERCSYYGNVGAVLCFATEFIPNALVVINAQENVGKKQYGHNL